MNTIEIKKVLLKRGNTAQSEAYTGLLGEVTLDTELNCLRIHDGITPGGEIVASTTTTIRGIVDEAIDGLLNGAPEALDTLKELADALGENTDSVTDILTTLATKADSADLATVAISGSYDDLADKPAIPADVLDLTDSNGLLVQAPANKLLNGDHEVRLNIDGGLTLPAGGLIVEGVVTENPTIELTPANPEAESQKLIIKGGGPAFTNTENDITVGTYSMTVPQGDVAYFFVSAPTYAGETFYWWIDMYSPDNKFQPDNGEIVLDEFGNASFDFTVLDGSIPFTVFVADTLYDAYLNNKGAASVPLNAEQTELPDLYHLHLTSGDLQETSIFLGTDEHNVRTRVDGSVELTSYDYDEEASKVWRFSKEGDLTAPGDIKTGTDDGRFIQDCAAGDTSMRWINVDEESSSTQLIRAYTGDPAEDNEVERAQIKLNWQNADQSGLTIRSFDQDDNDEHDWEFQGNGHLSFPNDGELIFNSGGEVGRIIPNVSDGTGLQVEAYLDFEIKVNDAGDGSGIWSFAGVDLRLPDDSATITIPSESVNGGSIRWTDGNATKAEFFLPNGDEENSKVFALYTGSGVPFNIGVNGEEESRNWKFGIDGDLTIPGDIVGYQKYIDENPIDERVTIQPSGSIDKPFKFITDQNSGTWLRSMMELPVAEVNKAVTMGFPHDDNSVGYIYAQGTDTISATEFNNAFNIMGNGTDVKISTLSAGGNKVWKFDRDGNLTLPSDGYLVVTSGLVTTGASPAPIISGFSITNSVGISGNGNISGSDITANGNITSTNIIATGSVNVAGNVTGDNLISSTTIYSNVDVVVGNIADASGTKTRITTFGANSYIQTGNGTVGSTGNIVFAPYLDTTEKVVIDTATGNVTAQNFTGNITITGNVTGTSANVDLVAGAYEWSFDNTGNLTLPGNTFAVNYANNTPVDVVTRFEGAWAVPTGNSTQSFTVDGNHSYQMWLEGNIPNGIIVWNATVTVTNTNVPVLGQQFAWNYEGGGNVLLLTSIPNQIVGTAGTISNAAPVVTNTNVFSFGINNASGSEQSIRYGWIKIS
jgi:hypothetical protein